MKKRILLLIFFWCLWNFPIMEVYGQQIVEETKGEETEPKSENADDRMEKSNRVKDELLEDMELSQMQDAVNQLLGEESFSVEGALEKIFLGEKLFSKEFFLKLIKEKLLDGLFAERENILYAVLLVLLSSVFTCFSDVFGEGQSGEISFYIIYMLVFASLIHSFGAISQTLKDGLSNCILFMKSLMPSYFLAVTAANGTVTAMAFYEMVMAAIYAVQSVLVKAVLPGINIYFILQLINGLHSEDFLSRMADLLKMVIEWVIKTCIAVVIGMQIVQNMIGPAVDSLKRDVIGKTASAIPGIGNVISGMTEVALGTAVLVRNGLGVLGILVLILLGLPPLVKITATAFLYKFLAAMVQPVADKRLVKCLGIMGEGCFLILKVLLTVELLFLITIAILSVSFFAH